MIGKVSEMAKSREMVQSSTKGFAAWQALTKALFDDYRPELHYMRGPGPKWREKHDWAVIDGPCAGFRYEAGQECGYENR